MTPSFEEKQVSRLLQSFPTLRMEEEKQREVIQQLRREKELLKKRRGRAAYRYVIGGGGVAALLGMLWFASPFLPSPSSLAPAHSGGQSTQAAEADVNGQPAEAGKEAAVLTIDAQIQTSIEQTIAKTFEAVHPERMTVIVSDPGTGEILAIGSRSKNGATEDAERFAAAGKAQPNPGAAYQIVTLAAAIQEGKFDPREIYESGTYKGIPGEPIKDFNNGIGWGKITFLEGFLRSSNVAFAKLVHERLHGDTLREYFERFGFGRETGVEAASEEAGQLPNMDEPRQAALAATGLGGAATPLQQMAAVGAIANGGKLMQPHLYKQAGADERNRYMVRQVVSEETARKVRDMLEAVVTGARGSGIGLGLPNVTVAAKHSVAEKVDPKGNALDGKYTVSVIGFAPSDQPKVLVYVAIDEPQSELPVVGWKKVVAPPFQEVLGNSLQHVQQLQKR